MFYVITMRVFCAGFTTVVSLRRGAAGFRNKSESEEAASRFVRAVCTARLIEIAEIRLPVWPEEAVRFGRQKKVFLTSDSMKERMKWPYVWILWKWDYPDRENA